MTDKQIILSLTRELEAATKPKWVSVSDRLPEVGVEVLVVNSKGSMSTSKDVGLAQDVIGKYNRSFYDEERDFNSVCASIGGGWSMNVTHWQPLPTQPEVK